MTRRLWPLLRGEPADLVRRSPTGNRNEEMRAAWSSHITDRALLLFTFVWFAMRIFTWQRIQLRPEAIYEQRMWLGRVIFPSLPDPAVWFGLVGIGLVMTLFCLFRPRAIAARIILAADILIVLAPELGFGHIMHANHLFLLAHVYAIFRPLGAPTDLEGARMQRKGYTWYLLGLLAVYTASGVWKIADMTIRDVIKPGVTWLDPEGMLSTSIAAMRNADLSMSVPQIVETFSWAFPIGYVLLTVIFSASFVAAFRRPLLFIVLPTVIAFHVLNAIFMRVFFIPTIAIATVLFIPYDFVLPAVRKYVVEPGATALTGSGLDACYERRYDGGDADNFIGYYAYREWLRDKSAILAAPLYFPGLGWAATQWLSLRRKPIREST